MSLNSTPSADRIHIGLFGRRNAGKSSIINAITGQNAAIVSDIRGTTTDPVLKSMELLPLGPVVIIDTPGLDDDGELGALRIQKAHQMLNKTDIALLIIDAVTGMTAQDRDILDRIQRKQIPCIIVKNKSDLIPDTDLSPEKTEWENIPVLSVSAKNGFNIFQLKEQIAALAPTDDGKPGIVGGLIDPLDFIVLVVPIDSAAPKGRLILPQQQTIRAVLDTGATAVVVREKELKATLDSLGRTPSLVITDSQAFEEVAGIVPQNIPLTSFSILFARHKGSLDIAVHGARALDTLKAGDTVLISEGCTHHRQCDDIGTVKFPRWIEKYTGKKLQYVFSSGTSFPDDLSKYSLIIHCGGCMLNEREIRYRMKCAKDAGIPITNYGIAIAHMHGILERSIAIFPDLSAKS